jgi:hypothetical protein
VKTTDILTEENRHPVYGEDNFSNPWENSGIRLLQKACSPVFAMDTEFWKLNREGDMLGHFPVKVIPVKAKSDITRRIAIFNDDLSDNDLELLWEVREGSPSNWVSGSWEFENIYSSR